MGQVVQTHTLELPYPPSVNHYWRRVGQRTLISREGRRYRETVGWQLRSLGFRRLEGPVFMKVVLYPPDLRKRDLDNPLKALLDALEHGGAYENDSQVAKLEVERGEVVARGRALVRLEKVENDSGHPRP